MSLEVQFSDYLTLAGLISKYFNGPPGERDLKVELKGTIIECGNYGGNKHGFPVCFTFFLLLEVLF